MKSHTEIAVTVERIGAFVEVMVGRSTVRMTLVEAHEMVKAIERAIDPPPEFKQATRIH